MTVISNLAFSVHAGFRAGRLKGLYKTSMARPRDDAPRSPLRGPTLTPRIRPAQAGRTMRLRRAPTQGLGLRPTRPSRRPSRRSPHDPQRGMKQAGGKVGAAGTARKAGPVARVRPQAEGRRGPGCSTALSIAGTCPALVVPWGGGRLVRLATSRRLSIGHVGCRGTSGHLA